MLSLVVCHKLQFPLRGLSLTRRSNCLRRLVNLGLTSLRFLFGSPRSSSFRLGRHALVIAIESTDDILFLFFFRRRLLLIDSRPNRNSCSILPSTCHLALRFCLSIGPHKDNPVSSCSGALNHLKVPRQVRLELRYQHVQDPYGSTLREFVERRLEPKFLSGLVNTIVPL